MFTWSLPNGYLVLDKRLLSKEEWQRMLDCLSLFKDGLVAAEQCLHPTADHGDKYPNNQIVPSNTDAHESGGG